MCPSSTEPRRHKTSTAFVNDSDLRKAAVTKTERSDGMSPVCAHVRGAPTTHGAREAGDCKTFGTSLCQAAGIREVTESRAMVR